MNRFYGIYYLVYFGGGITVATTLPYFAIHLPFEPKAVYRGRFMRLELIINATNVGAYYGLVFTVEALLVLG